jgi:hypothetical protein
LTLEAEAVTTLSTTVANKRKLEVKIIAVKYFSISVDQLTPTNAPKQVCH